MRPVGFALLVATFAITAVPAMAQAGDDAATRADRMAYQSLMKCFVANGVVVGDARDAHDTAKEAKFDAKAHEAFDLAVQVGQKLGRSGSHIDADFGMTQARELPRMVKDPAYFKEAVSTCRALGLM